MKRGEEKRKVLIPTTPTRGGTYNENMIIIIIIIVDRLFPWIVI